MNGSNTPHEAASWRRGALVCLWILCIGLPAIGDGTNSKGFPQYIREDWDVSRGYPGGRIYGITQSKDGYLWIGTDRGLIRFDGWEFRAFTHVGPLRTPIDSVYALAGDWQGNLLVSTESLQRLRLRNEALEELPRMPGQPEDPLSAIYQERNQSILIATVRRGMVVYDGSIFAPLNGTRSDVTAAVEARDGTVWMGTATEGLSAYPDRGIISWSKHLHHAKVNALLPFGEHGLWVGTDKGLLQWDGKDAPGRFFGPARVQAMIEDRQGNLWVGSTQGLFRIGSGTASHEAVPYASDVVTSLFEDREGDVWVGTATGITRLRQRVLSTYALDSGAIETGGALFADKQGTLWCARPGRGLVRIAGDQTGNFLPAGDYTSLAGDGQTLWLGQKDGALLRVKLSTSPTHMSAKKELQLPQPIIALFKSREGALWAGMQNEGVAEITDGHTTLHSKAGGLLLNTVTAIEQSRDGVMWVATASGVASLSHGHWKSLTAHDGLPPGRINCILVDGFGTVWVGANQGLAVIEKGNVRIPAWRSPLLHEPVLGIAVDGDDFLWILTTNHVLRAKREELLNGDVDSIFVRQFGAEDGLPGVPPSRTSRSIVSDTGGRIWISMGNTLVMADPFRLRQPSAPTIVQFQNVSADERSIPLGDTVEIPAGHLRTVIRFTGLNLAAPDRVRFRYKLSDFDREWSEASSVREATYTNLSPGSYSFEVKASSIDGLWNGPTAAIALSLEPAVWQTVWFRSSAVLAILTLGFTAYHLRLRAMKRQWNLRFQERLDERTRIARDLHDTLLQSFQGLILRFQAVRDMLPEAPESAGEALDVVIDRAAEAITEGRDAVQALRGEEEYDELGESLARIDHEFRCEGPGSPHMGRETSYRVLVEGTPRALHPVVRDDLYRIAREAVRNAFRHAKAKQIEVDIRYDDTAFRLRVRDDGSGIDPQVLHCGRLKGHYGLPGMRERATSIGGQFEIWSDVRRGTEIQITIPAMIAFKRFEVAGNTGLH